MDLAGGMPFVRYVTAVQDSTEQAPLPQGEGWGEGRYDLAVNMADCKAHSLLEVRLTSRRQPGICRQFPLEGGTTHQRGGPDGKVDVQLASLLMVVFSADRQRSSAVSSSSCIC